MSIERSKQEDITQDFKSVSEELDVRHMHRQELQKRMDALVLKYPAIETAIRVNKAGIGDRTRVPLEQMTEEDRKEYDVIEAGLRGETVE